MNLRPYQQRDVRSIFHCWKTHRSIVYVLPTAGGKTVVAARVIQQEVRAGRTVLVLAHRRELIDQARRCLIDDGIDPKSIGIIMSGIGASPDAPIQIASIQTLSRRSKPAAHVVVIDEAHHASADSYRNALAWYSDARWLGLTATPHRLNGRPLSGVFSAMVEGEKPSALIDGGWIMKPRVFTKKHGKLMNLSKIKVIGGDYDSTQLAKRVNTREQAGDILEHYQSRAGDRRTIGFCVNVAHAKRLCREFVAAGIASEVVHGGTSISERRAILSPGGRLDRGATKVVFTCMLVTEGWDLPSVKCAIIARPTKSTVLYLQMTGRVLRRFTDRRGCLRGIATLPLILDHFGMALKHGLPHADREWSLTQRVETGGGARPTCACPSCGHIQHVCRTCDACGFTFASPKREVVERRDLHLREVESIPDSVISAAFAQVTRFASERGIKDPKRWASKVIVSQFGRMAA